MADTPTPPVPTPTPTPDPAPDPSFDPPDPPQPPPAPLPKVLGNRRLKVIAVPLWWLAKPRPPGDDQVKRILSTLYRDLPPDTVFTGQSNVNIYTQSHDFVVTHPSFDEWDEGSDIPTLRPAWDNTRAAILYGSA